MRFRQHMLLCALLSLIVLTTEAALPARPKAHVTDEAQVLTPPTLNQIENLCGELRSKTAAQLAVVTVASLEGQDIETYTNELFKKWGIGEKEKDNGVLFLIAPNDRRARIEVGYGLEGILPDARVGRLMDENVLPFFRAGDFNRGILSGAGALATVIAQDRGVQLTGVPENRPAPHQQKLPGWLVMLIVIVLIFIFIRNPWLLLLLLNRGGGHHGGGGFGGGGFGGFGGGMSGGGGASRGW
jgi:uncharacterized protein